MGQRSLCAGRPFIPQEPAGWRRAHKSEGKENSACCVRSRKTIRDANDANDGLGHASLMPAPVAAGGVVL